MSNKRVASFLAMASAFIGGSGILGGDRVHTGKADTLDGVDINTEYALIQQKKSQLCRRLRNEVVYQWKQNHKIDSKEHDT